MSPKSLEIAILAFDNKTVGQYDPSHCISRGLAGSEEAIVYASECLAKLKHKVYIFANPPSISPWRQAGSNPQYVHYTQFPQLPGRDFKDKGLFDILILWRRQDWDQTAKFAKSTYYWPHDMAYQLIAGQPAKPTDSLNGIFYLTQYHQDDHERAQPSWKRVPSIIAGNGIVPEQFVATPEQIEKRKKNPYSCVYISNYGRGLIELIAVWPQVHEQFPKATLDIYYGRETWGTVPQHAMDQLLKDIARLSTKGVKEHGMVDHLTLANALLSASILAYPCNALSETFCIAVVKAQAAGLIPVTTHYAALKETVHPDAPVVPVNKQGQIHLDAYKDLLCNQLKRAGSEDEKVQQEVQEERGKYKDFAMCFTWDYVVSRWLALHKQIKPEDFETSKAEKNKKKNQRKKDKAKAKKAHAEQAPSSTPAVEHSAT